MRCPLVSIGIPAYKRKWLSIAIESALCQDYDNIEVVIVDDDSPQNLYEVVEPFVADNRVRYYKNERNLGDKSIVLNWNRCLDYARGDFFVLLCDDDIMSHEFVSVMMALFEKCPQCAVAHARKWDMNVDGTKRESMRWPKYETAEEFLRERLSKNRHHTISEFMIRTSSLRECGGYVVFPSGFYSDNASIILLAQIGGIVSSDKCLLTFRISNEHITGNTSSKNCRDKFFAALAYLQWIRRIPESKQYLQQIHEEVECTIYNCYKYAPLFDKIRILLLSPFSVVSFKQRIGYIYKSLIS